MLKESKGPDPLLLGVVLALLALGLVMVFSASYVSAVENQGDAYYYLKRQVLWTLVGLTLMFLAQRIPYTFWRKAAPFMLLGSLLLLVLVLMPGIGGEGMGARRWLHLGVLNVQPSEIAKLSVVVFLAAFLSTKQNRVRLFGYSVAPVLLLLSIVFYLIVSQPDLGTALILVGVALLLLFASGVPVSQLLTLGLVAMPGLAYVVLSSEYRYQRLLSFMNPGADPLGSGYQITQSLYAIGSGGLWGMGLGGSLQKWHWLPERHTDFIFAILGEELGFLGTMTVLILFFLLCWRGLSLARQAPCPFGSLLAGGIVSLVGVQALINMGVVTGMLPITGVPLPFISYGGSSLVPSLVGMGVVLNISRYRYSHNAGTGTREQGVAA